VVRLAHDARLSVATRKAKERYSRPAQSEALARNIGATTAPSPGGRHD